jgi:hypothetical protein
MPYARKSLIPKALSWLNKRRFPVDIARRSRKGSRTVVSEKILLRGEAARENTALVKKLPHGCV